MTQLDAPTDLAELRILLKTVESEFNNGWTPTSESIGLLIMPQLSLPEYESTPKNCVVFAETGGDGVHYSFLTFGEGVENESPIVMTVPMYPERANLIVGRNFREFLVLSV